MQHDASFATHWNVDALEEQYALWKQNPEQVGRDWQMFFQGLELGLERSEEEQEALEAQAGKLKVAAPAQIQ